MWQYHDKKLIELKRLYDKTNKQTQNKIQELIDTFNFNNENLYNIASIKDKKRINSYIEEWKDRGLLNGYFGIFADNIYKRSRVKNSEILELLIYSAYIEEQSRLEGKEQQIFKEGVEYYYNEGINEVRKAQGKQNKYSVIPDAIFLALLDEINSMGYTWKQQIEIMARNNANQIYRQVVISLMQQKAVEINSNEYQRTLDNQIKQKININGDKISGALDLELLSLNNRAKIKGIEAEDENAKVVFLANLDGTETPMCHSLHNQEFYINKENVFDRYYGDTPKTLSIQRIKCKGLVAGLNLPPINHHFHWCRSIVQYMPNKKETVYNDANESDVTEQVKRKIKQKIYNNKVISYKELPSQYKKEFEDGLLNTENNTKIILKNIYNKTDYVLTNGAHSQYRVFTNTIMINPNSKVSTLAHELFHKIDKKHGISLSNKLKNALDNDFKNVSLNKGDIINKISKIDSNAFTYNKKGNIIFEEKYRGIADIINGYSKGKIKLGYMHSDTYWKKNKNLEKETFAQFGRMYYENDKDVINVLANFLPSTKQYIDINIRKVAKKYV